MNSVVESGGGLGGLYGFVNFLETGTHVCLVLLVGFCTPEALD